MSFSFSSMLAPWQWAALATIPAAIIALYFLKLKRTPLEVPSTYLWHKSIEDLYVNSIWQRLRQSLLLFLQLLIVALVALALMRPGWRGEVLQGDRFIFLVDNSASMSATDEDGSRLAEAKRRVQEKIDQMPSGSVAMIVSFADGARVEQLFTGARHELRRRLAAIQQTDQRTSLNEALRVAASLANPGRSATDFTDEQVAEALPATLFILTDGRFEDVRDFSLGNLDAAPSILLGKADVHNVGIMAFSTGRSDDDVNELEAFARLMNFGAEDVTVPISLYLDGELIDADEIETPAGESAGVAFRLGEIEGSTLELRIEAPDALAIDNRAWTIIGRPVRSRTLYITGGNPALDLALETDRALVLSEITRKSPDYLATAEYKNLAATGYYDLIIYDRCKPETMPQSNTLFIGELPPGDDWSSKADVVNPQIIDTDHQHPLTQMVEMGNVQIANSMIPVGPSGTTTLIDSTDGPLLAIGPRSAFEDAVLGFPIYSENDAGEIRENTTWPLRLSFPVFVLNILQYSGAAQTSASDQNLAPGSVASIRVETPADEVTVTTPDGRKIDVARGKQNRFEFAGTDRVGVYEVRAKGEDEVLTRFAVNLFDAMESNIQPREKFDIGHVEIAGQRSRVAGRRDLWKWLVAAGIVVLLFEWYIYNRRVFI